MASKNPTPPQSCGCYVTHVLNTSTKEVTHCALHAAASELLESLEWAISGRAEIGCCPGTQSELHTPTCPLMKARAVIVKAKGR